MNIKLPSAERAELLRHVFSGIAPKGDWKAGIDVVIPKDMADITVEAVGFVTGTLAECHVIEGDPDHYRLVAIGYRMGPAGDY